MELCKNIEESDECQFTIKELKDTLKKLSGEKSVYTDMYLKKLLQEHFKERIVVSNISGKKNILCLSDNVHKILENWYKNREADESAEKLRIVSAAADIIREDVQKMTYERSNYPDIDAMNLGEKSLIPPTLQTFTEKLTKKKSPSELKKIEIKRNVINHAIISCIRLRSFISPLQIALGLTIHRLYGSKYLIDMLSAMGVCASYHEVSIYMTSLINACFPKIKEDAFIQHVFDNADVNVRTLDCLATFHAIRGIQRVTPSESVETVTKVERISSGSFNDIVIRKYSYPNKKNRGLSTIQVKDYADLKKSMQSHEIKKIMFPLTLIWIAGIQQQPGWNGFMTFIMSSKNFETAYILPVPFINMDPNDLSTIYTALMFAANQSKKQNQTCIVTFDQPLFLKASEIVASSDPNNDIAKIVLRLGGFHLLMSFMGSIGKIMEGSGLENLWGTVYGQSTVHHMMNGHAYERCVRAFTLTVPAIITILKEQFPEIVAVISSIKAVYDELITQKKQPEEISSDLIVEQALCTLKSILRTIESKSRTSKLWLNFIRQIDLILKFIYAERSGSWQLHVSTTLEMLPYFHAAGHLPYAKSAHLYAQQMINISTKMSEKELQLFTKKGFFTIRRSKKFWSGTWTDMCIEQNLMRSMKSIGGLTHGRGMTENTITKWILETPFFLKIRNELEEYLASSIKFGEQHNELRESRKMRDWNDIETFTSWLRQNNLFTKMSGELVSLSSGFISDESVNCDEAYKMGIKSMQNRRRKTFGELKMKRTDMIKKPSSSQSY